MEGFGGNGALEGPLLMLMGVVLAAGALGDVWSIGFIVLTISAVLRCVVLCLRVF